MHSKRSSDCGGIALTSTAGGEIREVIDDRSGIFPEEGVVGKPLVDFLDGDSLQKGPRLLEAIRHDGVAYHRELHFRTGGEPRLLVVSGIALDDLLLLVGVDEPAGTERYLNGLMKMNNEHVNELRMFMKERARRGDRLDLYDEMSRLNNELANTQRQLVKKTGELERLNEVKNRMLGMAAHDLRSPLTVLLNFTEFLMEDHEEEPYFTEEQFEMMREIKRSSEHMLYLMEDLLDISAIESGSIELKKETVDIGKLVERAVSLNSIQAEKKEIRLIAELPESTLVRKLDPHKFEQVLNNLISNAIKYSKPGTTTTVGFLQEKSDGPAVLYIRDQGEGIPEEEMSRLFQPFPNISVEPTGGEKSTGLGLAIAQKVMQAHGGEIRAESEVGAGTTFFVEIP